jgi:hypothetical protein
MIVLVTEMVTVLYPAPPSFFQSCRVKSYIVDLRKLDADDPYRRVLTSSECSGYIDEKNDIRWRECVTDEALLQFREAGKGNLEFPYAAVLEPPHQVEKFIYVYGVETEL